MKALIFHGPMDMRLEDIPTPKAARGEVLVKVAAVGMCGSDIHGYAGKTGKRAPGMVMGHEIAGTVAALGAGVSAFRVGQRVAVQPIIPCGACDLCRDGQSSLCPAKKMVGVSMGTVGGLSEFLAVPENNVLAVPDDLPHELGCLAEAMAVGVSVARHAAAQPDETVVIVGSGLIGVCILLALRDRGARRVFIVDQIARKLEAAKRFGAVPIDFSKEDALARIRQQTAGLGADVSIEAVGVSASVQTATYAARNGGRVLWVGNSKKMVEVDMQDVVVRGKSIQGIYCYEKDDFRAAIDFVGRNRKIIAEFVERKASPADAPALYTELAEGRLDLWRGVVMFAG